MPSLLHLDSSPNHYTSASRAVTRAFADAWQRANPDATYVYRDLAGDGLLPHIDLDTYLAGELAEAQHSDSQAQRWQLRRQVIDELLAADTILIGAPMHNLSIPSTLKAWLDYIVMPRFFADPTTGRSALGPKRVIVATARGGSYAPGSPRAIYDHQEPYLRAILGYIGLAHDLSFIHTELTLASVMPELAPFIEHAASSRDGALKAAQELGARV